MSTAVQATGFILSLLAWLLTAVSLINDYWKISSTSGSVIVSMREFENLWHSCAENSAGIAECRDFQSMLALPTHVQGARALMIVSLLLGLGAMIVALLGVKCIKIGSATDESKAKLAGIGGILSILGGLCSMTAVSWYAYRVVQEFYDAFYGGVKFELGTGLYIGWGGASLNILGGILLCTACKAASAAKASYPRKAKAVYAPTGKSDPDAPREYV
ncbi:uncharacterized protein V6R79_010589 [Siganus canaliculatus]